MDTHQKPYEGTFEYKFLWEFLQSIPPEDRIEKTELNIILDTIGAHNDIDMCYPVIDNFSQIASIAPKICRGPWKFASDRISKAAHPCKTLLHYREIITEELEQLDVDLVVERNSSFRGKVSTTPLYATLGYLTTDSLNLNRYHQLLAQVFIAYLLVLEREQKESFSELQEQAFDALRGIARDGTNYDLLPFPEKATEPSKYLEHIRQIDERKRLPNIVRFLSRALLLQTATSLHSLPANILPISSSTLELSSIQKLHPPEPDSPEIFLEHNDDMDDTGKAPPGFVFAFAPPKNSDPVNYDFRNATIQAAKSKARDNQHFCFAWNTLNQHDLRVLVHFLSQTKTNTLEDLKTIVQLGLMFFAGMTSNRISTLMLSRVENAPDNQDSYIFPLKTIRLISVGPKYTTKLDPTGQAQAHTKINYLDLDLPDFLIQNINRYIEMTNQQERMTTLFLDSSEQVQTACKRAISFLKKSNTRLTINRVQNYMNRRLASLEGNDLAGASLTLGKDIFLARTKIHYSCFDTFILRELHRQAWLNILRETGIYNPTDKQFPEANTQHIGTPIRPKISTIQELFKTLSSRIESLRTSCISAKDLIDFHNTYSTYTLLVVAYCTGYRAVNTPYITDDMYDFMTGYAVIRDKDSADFYHSRLTWLADTCVRQLRFYNEHVKQLKRLNAGAPIGLSGKESKFFFLTTEGRCEPATKSIIEKHLKKHGYHLPPNTQRHFLKSELQENGCPVEIIELFLGHWHLGQEGWSQDSGLHPYDFKSHLKRHLSPLLRRIGITPLPGVKKLPEIKLNLGSRTPETKRAVVSKSLTPLQKKVNSFLEENRPGKAWSPSNSKPEKKFNRQQKLVLYKIYQSFPSLFIATEEKLPIPPETVERLTTLLKPERMNPWLFRHRMTFLIKALEWGKKYLNWQVDIPDRPVIVPTGKNLIRPNVINQLKLFRHAEKAFLKDLEQPMPEDSELRVGQIFFSAILYSGINHPTWANAFLSGLGNKLFQYDEMLWADLWSQQFEQGATEQDCWNDQRNPTLYRRWFADPTTQSLIYRLLNSDAKGLELCRSCNSGTIYGGYINHLMKTTGLRKIRLKNLLVAANARTMLTLPPFLSAYAQNLIHSASLPDPTWMRIISGKNYPTTYPTLRKKRKLIPGADAAVNDQMQLLKELRKHLPTDKSMHNKQDVLKGDLHEFLNNNSDRLGITVKLLGYWASQLLSNRLYLLEARSKKLPEAPRTVAEYIGAFSEELITTCGTINILELGEDELKILFAKTVSAITENRRDKNGSISKNKIARILAIIDRLNQFLGFLQAFHRFPEIRISAKQNGSMEFEIIQGPTVRSNLITTGEYGNLLKFLGWGQEKLLRLQKINLVAAILAFRCGLRVSEIQGILIGDIQGDDLIELLVQKNHLRGIKTSSSLRRILLYLLLPKKEIDLVEDWLIFRKAELAANHDNPLFSDWPKYQEAIEDKYIFGPMRLVLKKLTDDDSLVPHDLRHSFDTWLLTKLSLRDDIDMGKTPSFLDSPEFDIDSCQKLRHALLENEPIGRKNLYAVAVIMGHADTETGLKHYMHLCDWLIWYYMRHPNSAPSLNATTLSKIIGCSKKNAYKIAKEQAHPLLMFIKKSAHKYNKLLAHPLHDQAYPRPSSNNKNEAFKGLPTFDIALHQLKAKEQEFLNDLKFPKSQIEAWIVHSWYIKTKELDQKKQRRFSGIAEKLLSGHKDYSSIFEITTMKNLSEVFSFFEFIGINNQKLEIEYFGSRWVSEAQRQLALKQWEGKCPLPIKKGENLYGKNRKNGCIRIELILIIFMGEKIYCDRHMINLFILYLRLISSNSRQISSK